MKKLKNLKWIMGSLVVLGLILAIGFVFVFNSSKLSKKVVNSVDISTARNLLAQTGSKGGNVGCGLSEPPNVIEEYKMIFTSVPPLVPSEANDACRHVETKPEAYTQCVLLYMNNSTPIFRGATLAEIDINKINDCGWISDVKQKCLYTLRKIDSKTLSVLEEKTGVDMKTIAETIASYAIPEIRLAKTYYYSAVLITETCKDFIKKDYSNYTGKLLIKDLSGTLIEVVKIVGGAVIKPEF